MSRSINVKGKIKTIPDRCGVCQDLIPDDDPTCRLHPETGWPYHDFCVTEDWVSTLKAHHLSVGEHDYVMVDVRGDGAILLTVRQSAHQWGSSQRVWIKGDNLAELKEILNG